MKAKESFIELLYPDEELLEQAYRIKVVIVTSGFIDSNESVRGKFLSIKGNNFIPTIIIKDKGSIVHESIHATIDFLRNLKFDFNALFDGKTSTGEEMFCCYHADISRQVENIYDEAFVF